MTTFSSVSDQQTDLFHRIARALDNTKKLGKERLNRHTLDARIESVTVNWDKFQANHDKLVAARGRDHAEHPYFVNDVFTGCEEAFFNAKSSLMVMRDELGGEADGTEGKSDRHLEHSNVTRSSAVRALPKITLPKFSGRYVDWPPFRDLFESMVGSCPDLSAVEKLHYLKAHVTEEAARLISNLPITNGNYTRAWDALVARYENKRALATSYLDQLFSVSSLTNRSADGLKQLMSTVNDVLGALRALDVPVAAWDVWLVYFVSRRLDRFSLEEWELHRGNTTELATFDELAEFIDGRVRALEMVGSRGSKSDQKLAAKPASKPKHAKVAAATAPGPVSCACCQANHYIAACPEFTGKSVEQRRQIVAAKKLCYNCLGGHKVQDCRTAQRCRLCAGQHQTLIHPGSSESNSGAGVVTPAAVVQAASESDTGSAVALSCSRSGIGDERCSRTLLATARVTVTTDRGESVEIRALLDQGSELTFVRESLVQTLRLPRHSLRPRLRSRYLEWVRLVRVQPEG